MGEEDVRWQQRFSNYCRALDQLERFLAPPALNEREQQGLIKAFEYTFELARNTNNRPTAEAIAANVIGRYLPCYRQLRLRLEERLRQERNTPLEPD
ncbi:MAG: nucleotidyltransferase substrate binding protein [Synechococcus sp.]|nr:nucleotidyltransferase substrate binding protein [Synechococcus sp.]